MLVPPESSSASACYDAQQVCASACNRSMSMSIKYLHIAPKVEGRILEFEALTLDELVAVK